MPNITNYLTAQDELRPDMTQSTRSNETIHSIARRLYSVKARIPELLRGFSKIVAVRGMLSDLGRTWQLRGIATSYSNDAPTFEERPESPN